MISNSNDNASALEVVYGHGHDIDERESIKIDPTPTKVADNDEDEAAAVAFRASDPDAPSVKPSGFFSKKKMGGLVIAFGLGAAATAVVVGITGAANHSTQMRSNANAAVTALNSKAGKSKSNTNDYSWLVGTYSGCVTVSGVELFNGEVFYLTQDTEICGDTSLEIDYADPTTPSVFIATFTSFGGFGQWQLAGVAKNYRANEDKDKITFRGDFISYLNLATGTFEREINDIELSGFADSTTLEVTKLSSEDGYEDGDIVINFHNAHRIPDVFPIDPSLAGGHFESVREIILSKDD